MVDGDTDSSVSWTDEVLTFRLFVSSQQSLLRQQERVEERVQEIEEQLCKLDSDKCVVEVCGRQLLQAVA